MTVEPLKSVLIECSASEGMFDTECAIAIGTLDGPVSLFADRQLVQSWESKTVLRSYASHYPGSEVHVLLPTEAFETGTRWIRVAQRSVH